jgi:hypothetical protein
MTEAQRLDIVPFLDKIYFHGVRKSSQQSQGPAYNLSIKLDQMHQQN